VEELLGYQDEGVAARSRGLGYAANPFFPREARPEVTGELPAEWRQRAEVWLFGWLLENAWITES
jgi:hypothetical protein